MTDVGEEVAQRLYLDLINSVCDSDRNARPAEAGKAVANCIKLGAGMPDRGAGIAVGARRESTPQ